MKRPTALTYEGKRVGIEPDEQDMIWLLRQLFDRHGSAISTADRDKLKAWRKSRGEERWARLVEEARFGRVST